MTELLYAAAAHHRARRLDEAEALYRAALQQVPHDPQALYGLGVLDLQRGRFAQAAERLEAALARAPKKLRLPLHQALASAYRRLQEPARAVHHYRRVFELTPRSASAALNLGAAAGDAGLYPEAADAFTAALALEPDLGAAREALALVLNRLGRYEEAVQTCEAGLAQTPGSAALRKALAGALKQQGRLDAAAEALEAVLRNEPTDTDALYNLAVLHKDQGRAEAAVEGLRRVIALNPGNAAARLTLCMAHLPPLYRDEAHRARSRADYTAELHALAAWSEGQPADALAAGVGASQPFYLAYQGEDDVELQRTYGRLVHRAMTARYPPVPLAPRPGPGERVRVGVVSGFLRDHANWRSPVRGWVEGLDRTAFELFGYHTGALHDGETARLRASFDRFVQGPLSTEAWRTRIAADRPHVLIYPEVGMDPEAVRLAAQRLAPVQCNSWGHPTTSGLPTLDVFLSSDDMEPPGAQDSYTERLVRLPGLSTTLRLPQASSPMARRSLGLGDEAVVFWCGQSLYKYLPRYDEVFARIADGVPQSQFVFIAFPESDHMTERFRSRLRSAFRAQSRDADRHCVILPRLNAGDYSAAMGAADVVLDSIGWSGCNSILDALACGLPVVTCEGDTLRARHGAALLRRAGQPDHVCRTLDDYVDLAVRLGEQRTSLQPGDRRIPSPGLGSDDAVPGLGRFLLNAVRTSGERSASPAAR